MVYQRTIKQRRVDENSVN